MKWGFINAQPAGGEGAPSVEQKEELLEELLDIVEDIDHARSQPHLLLLPHPCTAALYYNGKCLACLCIVLCRRIGERLLQSADVNPIDHRRIGSQGLC